MALGQQLYQGAAGFGKFYAIFSAIISTLFGIVLLIAGIWMLMKKKLYTKSVEATVDSDTCTQETHHDRHGDSTTYNCSLRVSYVVDGKSYKNTLAVDSSTDYDGYKTVTIYYNPHNPMDAKVQLIPWKILGWVCVVLGVFLPLGAWFWVWVTRRYKFAAAATGFGEGLHIAHTMF